MAVPAPCGDRAERNGRMQQDHAPCTSLPSVVMKSLVVLLGCLCLPLAAQSTTFTLPTATPATSNNLPFGGGIAHYQQWYSAAEVQSGVTGPKRLVQLDFLSNGGTQVATTLDLEVAVGHGFASGPSGIFASSFAEPPLIVLPRRTVNLVTAAAGAPAVTLPFATQFTWDGTSPLVVDIRIFGNGRANQTFTYDLRAAVGTALGKTTRLYALGNASATTATIVQPGWGLFTRFTMRDGVNLPFGAGCPGEGGFVPVATALSLAQPNSQWTHQLTQAPPQRLAAWVLGSSNTSWNGLPLPLDLGTYAQAPGCSLLVNPVHTVFTTAIGGSAGAGIATVTVALPPITAMVGLSVYTQWLVADPLALNGVLAASNGIWHIVAQVGG